MPEKHDTGKLRWDLVPLPGMEEVVRVLTDGAERYGDNNWFRGEGLEYSRLFAAVQRHLAAWWQGEDNSPDHGFHHLAHAASSLLTLVTYHKLDYQGVDDRPRFGKPATSLVSPAIPLDTVGSPNGLIKLRPHKNPTEIEGETK